MRYYRFNPPPNWPTSPSPDYTPPRDWTPPPEWGPPPSGWHLWVPVEREKHPLTTGEIVWMGAALLVGVVLMLLANEYITPISDVGYWQREDYIKQVQALDIFSALLFGAVMFGPVWYRRHRLHRQRTPGR